MEMDRRQLLKLGAATLSASLPVAALSQHAEAPKSGGTVEQWGLFEAAFKGPADGNPFQEVTLRATFTQEHRTVTVNGFYDGDGAYRIRFMPDMTGSWTYLTTSS